MRLSRGSIFFLLGASVFWGSTRLSAEPSEIQIFNRCYSQLTGTRVKSTHPTLARVASGELTGAEGCSEVLSKGILFTSGPNLGRTQGEVNAQSPIDTQDAHNLLRTLTQFHKTWVSTTTIGAGIERGNEGDGADELYSQAEFAHHLSYTLLHPSLSYRDLITGVRSVVEVRDAMATNGRYSQFSSPTELYTLSHFVHNFLPGGAINNPANLQSIGASFLQQGVLRGFRELTTTEMNARLKLGFRASTVNYTNQHENTQYNYLQNSKYLRARGGGVIGTPSYMMTNLGAGWTPQGYPRANGANKVWRRMIRNSFSDLMCRSLPVVNVADITAYVRPSSTLPYRSNASCVSCHATIDLGSGVFRNFNVSSTKVGRGLPDGFPRVVEVSSIVSHPSVVVDSVNLLHESMRDGSSATYSPAETDLMSIDTVNVDNIFFKRPPNGRFIMRTYNDTLIDKAIYDIEGYGNEIANTDDFYICAAKRYVNFLTGFDATMQDVPSASPEEIQSRNFVIQLGLELKQHQSLRHLIESIVDSDLYRGSYE